MSKGDTPKAAPMAVLRAACVVAVLALALFRVDWLWNRFLERLVPRLETIDQWWSHGIATLLLGLLITLWAPRTFGLCFGKTGREYRLFLLAFGACTIVALMVVLFVETPFYGESSAIYMLVPLEEEILFRGFAYTCLAAAFPFTMFRGRARISVAVIASAAAFSLAHLPLLRLPENPFIYFQVFYTFVAGVITGILRERTGSILGPWAIHAAVNAMAVLIPPIFEHALK